MSRESDHIEDLNSDDLLFERQNDMHEVIVEKFNPIDGVPAIISPTNVLSSQDPVIELESDELSDTQRVTVFAETLILGGVAENMNDKTEVDVDMQFESGDKGSDSKTDVRSVDKVSSAVEICSSNVERANFSNNDENPNECNAPQVVVGLRSIGSRDKNMYWDMSMTKSKSVASPTEFCISDLVWGKVRSHPWWPGQILDPSTSSGEAKKYFKRNGYLIAYFWDNTFAWNEVPLIKPFRDHFLPMEKQSSSENFQHAIHCALDEISRRVELGLACPCIPNEVYQKLKTQIFINAGIQEELIGRDGGDRFSSASSFEPLKLVMYIKTFAHHTWFRQPNRVDFVTSQAQLLAFNRWRGYSQLPEFQMLGGLLESEAENDMRTEDENEVTYKKDKLTNREVSSRKRKEHSGDSIIRKRKEKTLSNIIAENRRSNGKNGLGMGKISGRKRKVVDESICDLNESSAKRMESHLSMEEINKSESAAKRMESHLSMEEINKSQDFNKTFRVGASILRVASQMNRSSSLLKRADDLSQKADVKSKRKEKSLSKNLFISDSSSQSEPLSQLCLVARNPKENSRPLNSVISFFSEFRDSVSLEKVSSSELEAMEAATSLENVSLSEHEEEALEAATSLEKVSLSEHEEDLEAATSSEKGISSSEPTSIKLSLSEHEEEVPTSIKLSLSEHEEEVLEAAISSEKGVSSIEPTSIKDPSSEQCPTGGDLISKKNHAEPSQKCNENIFEVDVSPTVLILNFTDFDSIPSEANLNEIFSQYGHVIESHTEVMKKSSRAKVVFTRRADAELAFSSAGKYSTFGSSLVSYRLRYMPSVQHKATSAASKRTKATSAPGKRTKATSAPGKRTKATSAPGKRTNKASVPVVDADAT